jgi:hypothetical protein
MMNKAESTMNKLWEDATTEEKEEVVRIYNQYYDNVNEPIDLAKADRAWSGRRWMTIKYTFGVKPV